MRVIKRLLISLGSLSFCTMKFRLILFKSAGMSIGNNTEIRAGFFIDRPDSFFIGNNSFINRFVHIFNGGGVDSRVNIGNNVFVGPEVKLVCVSHNIGGENKRAGDNTYESINIDDGVWIGTGVTVLPGVRISKGCVIGSGSLVTKSTEPNGIYYGVPARRIRNIDDVV